MNKIIIWLLVACLAIVGIFFVVTYKPISETTNVVTSTPTPSTTTYPTTSSTTSNSSSTPEAKTGLIIENLKANDVVASPLQITGYTNGNGWGGFEGQVGSARLYDNQNHLLDTKPLTAVTNWMTSTVYFETNLEFNITATSGKILFRNENPSGDPIRDKQVIVPVKFK